MLSQIHVTKEIVIFVKQNMKLSCLVSDTIFKGEIFSIYIKFEFTNCKMNLLFNRLNEQNMSWYKYGEKR